MLAGAADAYELHKERSRLANAVTIASASRAMPPLGFSGCALDGFHRPNFNHARASIRQQRLERSNASCFSRHSLVVLAAHLYKSLTAARHPPACRITRSSHVSGLDHSL